MLRFCLFLIQKKNYFQPKRYLTNARLLDEHIKDIPQSILIDLEKKIKDFPVQNADYANSQEPLMANAVMSTSLPSLHSIIKNDPRAKKIRLVTATKNNSELNRVIFSANYNFDENRTRIVPQQIISKKKKNILLIGCSFTFGVGVQDNQTIAHFLKQKLPNYNIYNLGIPSGGMSDMLDDIYTYDRIKELNKNGGVVIYYFVEDHFERTFCSLDCYRDRRISWSPNKNYYDFDSDEKLINHGQFKDSRPWRYQLFKHLGKSEFLKFVGFEHPKIYSRKEQQKYIKFIKTLQAHYVQFNLDFILYSDNMSTGQAQKDFYKDLSNNNIPFFLVKIPQKKNFIQARQLVGDYHHSAFGNYSIASLLTHRLREIGY